MTWRIAIDRYRSDTRRVVREQSAEMREERSAEDVAAASERAKRLWQAIDELPPKFRIVTVLAAIEGHDIAAVARLLQLPSGTVKSRLFLARKQLAEKLQCLANDTPRP
jgi:RNA polymerase sigma-70 factor (ECF subfamily)